MDISKMLSNDSYTGYASEDELNWGSSDDDTVTDAIGVLGVTEEFNKPTVPQAKVEGAGDLSDAPQNSIKVVTLVDRTVASQSTGDAGQMQSLREEQSQRADNATKIKDDGLDTTSISVYSPVAGYKRKAIDISVGDGVGLQGSESSVSREQLFERPRTPFPMLKSHTRTEGVSLWAQQLIINLKQGPGLVLIWNQYRRAWQGEAGGEIWSARYLLACLDNLSITVGNKQNTCVTQLINGEGRWRDGPDGSIKKLRLDRWKMEQLVRDGRAFGYLN